jgi:hypothetical protein
MGRISRVRGKTSAHRLGTRGAGKPGRSSVLRSEAVLASEEAEVVAAPPKKKKKAKKKAKKSGKK